MLPQEGATLAQRMDMAAHRFDVGELGARNRQQVMLHPLEMLADDMQPRIGHQVVDVGHPPRHRVLDRNQAQPGAAFLHGGKGVLEGRAGQGLEVGEGDRAGQMRIGTGLALKGDLAVGAGIGIHDRSRRAKGADFCALRSSAGRDSAAISFEPR